MSTIGAPTANNTTITPPESKYRSMFKPSKFIWRNNKTTPTSITDSGDTSDSMPGEEEQVESPHSLTKLPSIKFPSPSVPYFGKKHTHTIALKETGKNEVYELSTVSDSGLYLTPLSSPSSNSKHDHWLDVDDNDAFYFSFPSHDCLTTVCGGPHSFYTPSSIMISA